MATIICPDCGHEYGNETHSCLPKLDSQCKSQELGAVLDENDNGHINANVTVTIGQTSFNGLVHYKVLSGHIQVPIDPMSGYSDSLSRKINSLRHGAPAKLELIASITESIRAAFGE